MKKNSTGYNIEINNKTKLLHILGVWQNTQGNTLLNERTQTMNNKIKLHILGVLIKKLIRQLVNN